MIHAGNVIEKPVTGETYAATGEPLPASAGR
jgi:hypothetical protein